MTNYDRGTAFERQVMVRLRDDGYWVARVAGSRGAADLVAVKPGQVLLVQCKLDAGLLGPADWNTLVTTAAYAGAQPMLAHKPARGRIEYWRLTGPREPRRAGAYEVWTPDEAGAGERAVA